VLVCDDRKSLAGNLRSKFVWNSKAVLVESPHSAIAATLKAVIHPVVIGLTRQ